VLSTAGAATDAQPGPLSPGDHTFLALGAPAERKVDVAWNRYYDHAGLTAILTRLHEAFPTLTRLYSIGKSTEGRDLWCLEVTARDVGNPDRKAGMYIDGNIHGNEVQAGEVIAYTGWYLCHQYGRLEKVTSLLNDYVFYLVPMVNPDGRDFWLHDSDGAMSSRSGSQPTDNDRDGVCDEDDCEDLNGDGVITQMRIKDPHGRYKRHPDYPEYLMVRAKDDEPSRVYSPGSAGRESTTTVTAGSTRTAAAATTSTATGPSTGSRATSSMGPRTTRSRSRKAGPWPSSCSPTPTSRPPSATTTTAASSCAGPATRAAPWRPTTRSS
jgi:hypothetical protein